MTNGPRIGSFMHTMVESQVPRQCCGHGCCPANRCLTCDCDATLQQLQRASHHFDVQTRKRQGNTSQSKETQCKHMQKCKPMLTHVKAPTQCTLWFGSCPGSTWCGCWCTSTSTPTHDLNIRAMLGDLSSRLRGVNIASIKSLSN